MIDDVKRGNGSQPLVVLTGATGYVGGRLLPVLESAGRRVRCLARSPAKLSSRMGPATEVVAGDVLDPVSLEVALHDAHTAYFLVHSMAGSGSFQATDRQAALNFGEAARRCELRRIIYLGGLGAGEGALSSHLRSRQEVGEILRESGVPVTEFRASVIIGAGSLSFQMIRALVDHLPVMVTPRWVLTPAQPIAIDDVIAYLMAALVLSGDDNRIFEIGGADSVSYGAIMREYARQRGLHRLMIPVPVLTPWLSSLWLGLVTPLQARVGRKMIDGVRYPTLVRDPAALEAFAIRPVGITEAVRRALADGRPA